jgi:hypothetical protein
MRSLAPKAPGVQSDPGLDALLDVLCPPDPFAGLEALDFSAILRDVKPWPRRARPWNQRDVTRALRAAKTAGVEVCEITPDGRVILGSPAETENPWGKFRHG